jgi:hypothetical protein
MHGFYTSMGQQITVALSALKRGIFVHSPFKSFSLLVFLFFQSFSLSVFQSFSRSFRLFRVLG